MYLCYSYYYKMEKKSWVLLGFILLKFVLHYVLVSDVYQLQRDEYLHLDQANHLAWGYLSVPPLTSWVSVIIKFLGNSEFWVRFFPALFGVLTMVLVWKAIKELGGNLFALIVGMTGLLFSALLRLNILFQPNSFDVLAWTAVYYFVIKYINTTQSKWLYYLAFSFALGFLNKYNIVFLLLGLIPAILLTKERLVLTKGSFYIAILLVLLLILPNLYWQYIHDFPVVYHMKQLTKYHLVNVNRLKFLESQLLYFFGSIPLLLAAIYAFLFHKPFRQFRVFLYVLVFTLAVFMYFKAKSYYAIGLFPIYIAFGAVFLSQILRNRWIKWIIPAYTVVVFVPMIEVFFPNKTPEQIIANADAYREFGLLKWEDGKEYPLPQDFADMLGWKEMATKVEKAYNAMPNKEKTLIMCDNYGQAGAINYYSKGRIKAHSLNADYVNWFDLTIPYENLIRVKNAGNFEAEIDETSPYFDQGFLSDSIANAYAREYRASIISFVKAKVNINERIQAEIDETKKREKL